MTTPSPTGPTLVNDVPPLPPRSPSLHKGQAGRVCIIAGSRGLSGAAVLAAEGALRGGAGLVRVCCPVGIQPVVAAAEPCAMTFGLPEDPDGRVRGPEAVRTLDWDWPTVVAIGPGLGRADALPEFVAAVLRRFGGPVVVDADGLNNLAPLAESVLAERADRPTILTPHPGEMARLRAARGWPLAAEDDAGRLRSAHEYAAAARVTVVLKGHRTVVATGTHAYVNTTGNAGMASGGMGDVLTGLVAALVAQGLPAFEAARLAVYVHGLAADHAAVQLGPVGYLARDVADFVPAALAEASRPRIGFR